MLHLIFLYEREYPQITWNVWDFRSEKVSVLKNYYYKTMNTIYRNGFKNSTWVCVCVEKI